MKLQYQRVESYPIATTKNMILYLDEGETHDGQDPRRGTFTVCSRVETEDLTVRTEGKWYIFPRLLSLVSEVSFVMWHFCVLRMKRW